MLFNIHQEGKIAYKRLSDADLKRGDSHQTHIGLSNNSLTFMQDDKMEYSAMLIYETYCDFLTCEVGKIHREDGRADAPKVSVGSNEGDSIVNKVRAFAEEKRNTDFYLLWFGLDTCRPAFWLVAEGSEDYNHLNEYCGFSEMKSRSIKIVDQGDVAFPIILSYAKQKLEDVSLELDKDLELTAELEEDSYKFKDEDIYKAKKYIQKIGRDGEEMINEYLSKGLYERKIDKYEWANQSYEKGKPYDFWIKYADGLEQWVDVKTTEHEFNQAIIVSKNEINFIASKPKSQYAVFRLYSKKQLEAKLKVCNECLKYIQILQSKIDFMTLTLSESTAKIINYKIAFEPNNNSFRKISSELDVRI